MGWMDEFGVDAVLLTGLSGMAGGAALAEILEGKVNPSGKLAVTWAYDYHDYITSENFIVDCSIRGPFAKASAATVYEEGLYVGCRYFDTFKKKLCRPFGFGLSYTTFEQNVLDCKTENDSTIVRVSVVNKGAVSGKEVVELYASLPEVAMPDTVMTGYNTANGLYCSNDKALIMGILRNEMGFDGYVMTDWGGFGNRGPEGLMDAGVSWIAPGSEDDTFTGPIVSALHSGTLSRAKMQQNALRLIRVLVRHA